MFMTRRGVVTVSRDESDKLTVAFPYNPQLVEKVKTVHPLSVITNSSNICQANGVNWRLRQNRDRRNTSYIISNKGKKGKYFFYEQVSRSLQRRKEIHKTVPFLGGRMKRYFGIMTLSIFAAIVFYGCVPPTNTYTPTVLEAGIPIVGKEKTVSTGEVFFEFVRLGGMYDPNNAKYDLTVVELTKDKIGLQYSEYLYRNAKWLIKEGFNKRFDYPLNDNFIKFRDYEFEIISVDKGQIKYKRIK